MDSRKTTKFTKTAFFKEEVPSFGIVIQGVYNKNDDRKFQKLIRLD
jgi:hypothetical protein